MTSTCCWHIPLCSKAGRLTTGGVTTLVAYWFDPSQAPEHQLVCWARNAVGVTRNTTQHGEVRLLTNYLHQAEARQVPGLKLYTTLEPCAMCAGMMSLTGVRTAVFGQSDPHFGGVLQRLAGDPDQQQDEHCPYPRGVQAVASAVLIRAQLDAAYEEAGKPSITDWLAGDEARLLFAQARGLLDSYEVQFKTNAEILERARSFLELVPAEYVRAPYGIACEEPMMQKASWFEWVKVRVTRLVRNFVE